MQNNPFARLIPFILFGVAIVTFFLGLVILTYILFFGALVGLALFVVMWIKDKFFPDKRMTRPAKKGRTFDQK